MTSLVHCQRQVLFCPFCDSKDKTTGKRVEGHVVDNPAGELFDNEWCKTVECVVCFRRWFVCSECVMKRTHMKDNRSVRRHSREYHSERRGEATKPRKRKRDEVEVEEIKDCNIPKEIEVVVDNGKETEECVAIPPTNPSPELSRNMSQPLSVSEQEEELFTFEILDDFDAEPVNPPTTTTMETEEIHKNEMDDCKCTVIESDFDRAETMSYFEAELLRAGGGGRQLVAETFYKGQKDAGELEEDNINICLQMSLLVHSLTTRQNTLLAHFLDLLFQKIERIRLYGLRNKKKCTCRNSSTEIKEENKIENPPKLPPIPRSIKRIRSIILTGKHAFLPKLARPLIRMEGRHAYVLPSECIKTFLGNGYIPLEFSLSTVPSSYKEPNETPRGVAISRSLSNLQHDNTGRRHLPLSFIEWKDDCEALKSNKASKHGSIWVWTMTIFQKNGGLDSSRATFPLAVGYKKDDHDPVEKIRRHNIFSPNVRFIGRSAGETWWQQTDGW
jgi:hypothetical protein